MALLTFQALFQAPYKNSLFQIRKLRQREFEPLTQGLSEQKFEPELGCEPSHLCLIICVHDHCYPSKHIY